jgi:hypothetical protein
VVDSKNQVYLLLGCAMVAALFVVLLQRGSKKKQEREEKIERAFNDMRDVLLDWMH